MPSFLSNQPARVGQIDSSLDEPVFYLADGKRCRCNAKKETALTDGFFFYTGGF